MTHAERYSEAVAGPWETAGDDIQFRLVTEGDTLKIFFQCTDIAQTRDIINDIDFPIILYRDEPIKWYVHRGFARGFKSVIDTIGPRIVAVAPDNIYIAGFSAGGAYATLMHEWCWFHGWADVESWTFGAPRVCYMLPRIIHDRFENLHRVYDFRDIFTHLPPWVFGYEHVGQRIRVGRLGWPTVEGHKHYGE